eukprot:gene20853-27686_t
MRGILVPNTALVGVSFHQHKVSPQYVTAPFHRSAARCKATGSDPNSTRKVTSEDVDRLSETFGPTRYKSPNPTPKSPSVIEKAAAAAMLAIEAARTLAEALARLTPDTLDAASGSDSAAETEFGKQRRERGLNAAMAEADLGEMQVFGRELLDVCRYAVESHFRLHQTASLLSSFLSIGIAPPNNWLLAAERAMLRHLNIASEADSIVFMSASADFVALQYQPSREWTQSLSEAATRTFSVGGSTPRAKPKFASPDSYSPSSVVLANGEEMELDEFNEMSQTDGGERGKDGVPLLPAQCLAALAQAIMLWSLPTDEDWMLSYLRVLYPCMESGSMKLNQCLAALAQAIMLWSLPTDEDWMLSYLRVLYPCMESGSMKLNQVLSDCAWSLVMSEVRPDEVWLSGFLVATQNALAQQDDVGPSTVSALLGVLDEFEMDPGQEWVEMALQKAARSDNQGATADLLGYMLFEASKLGREAKDSETISAVEVIAQEIQFKMLRKQSILQEKQAASKANPDAPADYEDDGDLSPYGLTVTYVGLARLGVLSKMQEDWLQAWTFHASIVAADLSVDQIMGIVMASQASKVTLLPEATFFLISRLLQPISIAAPPEPGALAKGTLPTPAPAQYALNAEQLATLLDTLAELPYALPGRWLRPLRSLIQEHRPALSTTTVLAALAATYQLPDTEHRTALSTTTVLAALATIAHLENPNEDTTEGSASLSLVQDLLVTFREAGGMENPQKLVEAASAVAAVGGSAATMMVEIEKSCLALVESSKEGVDSEVFCALMQVFTNVEYTPSAAWWTAFKTQFERSSATVTPFNMGAILSCYGSLALSWSLSVGEMTEEEELAANVAAEWCEVVAKHAEFMILNLSAATTIEEIAIQEDVCSAACSHMLNAAILSTDGFELQGGLASQTMSKRSMLQAMEQADATDVVSFLRACYQFSNTDEAREEVDDPPAESIMLASAGPELVTLIMQVAHKNAADFSRDQILIFMESCEALGLGAALRGPPGVLQILLGSASNNAQTYSVEAMAELFSALRRLNVKPGPKFVDAFFKQLQTLVEAPITDENGVRVNPFMAVFAEEEAVASVLFSVLDAWAVVLPVRLLPWLPQLLVPMAESAPSAAVELLTYMSNLRQVEGSTWQPDPDLMAQAVTSLAGHVRAGGVHGTSHASLLYALAKLGRSGPAKKRQGGIPDAMPKAAAELCDAVVVVTSNAPLAAYTVTDALVMFSSLAALRHPIAPGWAEQLFVHTGRALATSCPPDVVAAAAAACASACTIALPSSTPTPEVISPSEAESMRPLGLIEPPQDWLSQLLAAVRIQQSAFKMSDLVLLLDSLAALKVKPEPSLLQGMLNTGLLRAQAAAADRADAAAASGSSQAPTTEPSPDSAATPEASGATATTQARQQRLQRLSAAAKSPRSAGVPVYEAEQLVRLYITASKTFEFTPEAEWTRQLKTLLVPFIPAMDQRAKLALKDLFSGPARLPMQ